MQIDRQVRAFVPWPIAETRWHGEQLRVWEAQPLEKSIDAQPGTVVSAGPQGIDVVSGAGAVRLLKVQQPGRKTVSAGEFARSHDLHGTVLGA